jgi:hypothetical protein
MSNAHFMVDLETMGLAPNAAIVSIGIAEFDRKDIVSKFYTPVSLQSCLDAGLTTTQSTVDWWQQQSVEARMAWQTTDAPSLESALREMGLYLLKQAGSAKRVAVWGNGANFDPVLLTSAYEALRADPPWEFWNVHCFRTMKNMFRVQAAPRSGTHHNALDDAVTQALHLQRILANHNIELS